MALANNSIFISYRKDDAGGWAPKLASDLRAIVGVNAVFLDDSTGIPYGSRWPDQISIALDQCRVFLPVIAPNWSVEPNLGRLRELEDWVRQELATAHARQPSVLSIPVFVNEASAFDSDQFSDDAELQTVIKDLMKQQGIALDRSPEYWPDKIDGLVSRIEAHLGVSIPRQSESSKHVSDKAGDPNTTPLTKKPIGLVAVVSIAVIITALVVFFLESDEEPSVQELVIDGTDNTAEQIHENSGGNQSVTIRGEGNTAAQKQ